MLYYLSIFWNNFIIPAILILSLVGAGIAVLEDPGALNFIKFYFMLVAGGIVAVGLMVGTAVLIIKVF